jgi:hypothetical protein
MGIKQLECASVRRLKESVNMMIQEALIMGKMVMMKAIAIVARGGQVARRERTRRRADETQAAREMETMMMAVMT